MHDELKLLADTCNADFRNECLVVANHPKAKLHDFKKYLTRAFRVYTNRMTAHDYMRLYQQRGGWD